MSYFVSPPLVQGDSWQPTIDGTWEAVTFHITQSGTGTPVTVDLYGSVNHGLSWFDMGATSGQWAGSNAPLTYTLASAGAALVNAVKAFVQNCPAGETITVSVTGK